MTTEQAVVPRNRRPRGQHPRPRDPDGRKGSAKKLPVYLEAHQVEALIRAAPNPRARLLFLIEWRAGLRISEALALEARDLSLESELPSIRVREGKGSKPRIVPVHPELNARPHQRTRVRRRRTGRTAGQGVPCDGRPVDKESGLKGRGAGPDTRRAVAYRTTRSGTPTPVTCWPTAGRSTSCRAGWVTPRSTRHSSTWSWCRTRPAAWRRCRRLYESERLGDEAQVRQRGK